MSDLYAVRPEEFVAARKALVTQLKADGNKEEAAATAKLRRPSVAAWALNQVAREEPARVAAAIEAGRRLRAVSDATVAGRPGELRAATADERDAANAVVKAAAHHLGERAAALTPALLATIRVAALDDDVADQLERGVLVTEQEQPGFGFGVEGEVAPVAPSRRQAATKPTPRAKPKPKPKPNPKPKATASAAPRQAAADERVAARAHKRAVTEAQRTLDRKAREARRLAKEADQADAAAVTARAVATQAEADAAAAQRALDALG